MSAPVEFALTIALWGIVLALPITAGLPGLIAAAAWVGLGIHLVMRSRSRGWLADLSFMVTWPIYVVMEGNK